MKLVIATANKGKLSELQQLLLPVAINVLSASQMGITSFPAEDGASYCENALIKAKYVTTQTGLAALADDSGLEVAALDGAPGIYSARLGNKETDKERNNYLLAEMKKHADKSRNARFVCCLALTQTNAPAQTFQGVTTGKILEVSKGESGFGYDPIFLSDDLSKSFAEASKEEKQKVSHRGRALQKLLEYLKNN